MVYILKNPSLAEAMYNNGYTPGGPCGGEGASTATPCASCKCPALLRNKQMVSTQQKDPNDGAVKRKLYTLEKEKTTSVVATPRPESIEDTMATREN
jgi:hypothetical protein